MREKREMVNHKGIKKARKGRKMCGKESKLRVQDKKHMRCKLHEEKECVTEVKHMK